MEDERDKQDQRQAETHDNFTDNLIIINKVWTQDLIGIPESIDHYVTTLYVCKKNWTLHLKFTHVNGFNFKTIKMNEH
jgi:hypothetical protein